MPTTTAARFGHRDGAAALGAVSASPPPASDAAAAFEAATQWNRVSSQPTLASLTPLPPQDLWAPTSASTAAGHEVAPAAGLLSLLFSTKGRIRRRDFWTLNTLAWLILVLGMVVLFIDLPLKTAAIGACVLLLLYARIGTALRIKRWHDRDKSAMWVWIGLLPMVGWAWAFVECAFLEGTPGPNRYGLPPK